MSSPLSRRDLLKAVPTIVSAGAIALRPPPRVFGAESSAVKEDRMVVSDSFPAQPPELVREMVIVAHFDLKRVKELVEGRPALAKASWDWGFGDWETAVGAASHMGNRAIAEYLIEQGAPPTLFSAAMLGQLEVVKLLIGAHPGVQSLRGPHSISLLAHARVGGGAAKPVLEFLQSLKGADMEAPEPLSEEETSKLLGTYMFGIGTAQQVDVTADLKMYAGSKMYTHAPQLNWTRKGTMTRPLFHLGGRVFHPAGAPSARIRFAESADGMEMRVSDGEVEMSALRKEQKKG